MAIPTTASMPSASSSSISACVVTPPAAISGRRVASRTARIAGDVGALHQSLFVDVCVEKLAAVGFERTHGIDGGRAG